MDISKVKTVGSGILRPEGVMALDDGTLYTADARGQCARIDKKGQVSFFGDLGGVPNGICIDTKGRCIVANIGNGQVQALAPDGSHDVLLTEAEGRRMRAPNFPYVDSRDRLWVSNSTEKENIDDALWRPEPDGCVVLIENGHPRIVADDLYFANGLTLDHEERYLYVAQTMRLNIMRYEIRSDGSLGQGEPFGPSPLSELGFPDGIAFDEAGNLWITFPQWNSVGYLTPSGELRIVLEDPHQKILHRPTNICFGGPGRKTSFLGSLDGTTIPWFEVSHAGMRLVHQS